MSRLLLCASLAACLTGCAAHRPTPAALPDVPLVEPPDVHILVPCDVLGTAPEPHDPYRCTVGDTILTVWDVQAYWAEVLSLSGLPSVP